MKRKSNKSTNPTSLPIMHPSPSCKSPNPANPDSDIFPRQYQDLLDYRINRMKRKSRKSTNPTSLPSRIPPHHINPPILQIPIQTFFPSVSGFT